MTDPTHEAARPRTVVQEGAGASATLHNHNQLTVSERRRLFRRNLNQPLCVMPILENGYPDGDHFRNGVARDLCSEGLGWDIGVEDWDPRAAFVVGLAMPDGLLRYAGVVVCHAEPPAAGRVAVGSRFGGHGQEILRPENLRPAFQAASLLYTQRFPEEMLQRWSAVGILQPAPPDQAQLCPRCRGLPTFRPGCRQCGSADVGNDQLLHHFSCAHVGHVRDFETPAGLVCPKCRTRALVIGADFEYLTGPYACRKCQWSDMELEQVARCLRCAFSFPAHQAVLQELGGYCARRLDPLLDHLEQVERQGGLVVR